MSLLDDFARTCILLEKKRVPDGAGGYIVEWTEGAEFTNYQALDTFHGSPALPKNRA